jgi:hypothetical protein
LPFVTTRFLDENYSLFLAPIAKVGFTTLTGDLNTIAATPLNGNANTTPTSSAPPVLTGRFNTSFASGARLGLYRNFHTREAAPDLVSFIDITPGKFGGFEAYRNPTQYDPPSANPSGPVTVRAGEFITVRPWRWSIEGLLKIPHSPFVVGFNANLRMYGVPAFQPLGLPKGVVIPFAQPKDDLRFLFGARFDAAKLLHTLPSLQ